MAEQVRIMNDSPEAASIQTVTGWVSRTGRFWGDDERMARYDGSTQRVCDCGEIVEQRSYCKACSERSAAERWSAFPAVEWDGITPLCAGDTYFFDMDDLADYCDENGCTPSDLQLIICVPNYIDEVDLCELNADAIPEDGGTSSLPESVASALRDLNQAIKESRTPDKAVSWSPGKTRPTAQSIVAEMATD